MLDSSKSSIPLRILPWLALKASNEPLSVKTVQPPGCPHASAGIAIPRNAVARHSPPIQFLFLTIVLSFSFLAAGVERPLG
jgi:hypothetical protein